MNRIQITDEQIEDVLEQVRLALYRRFEKHGRGAHASIHESFGIIAEEVNKELMDAMHASSEFDFFFESEDVAVAAMFAMISIEANKEVNK